MYTLRIIDQTKVGAEERRNIPFDGGYSVLMKVPIKDDQKPLKQGSNVFDAAVNEFYGVQDNHAGSEIDQTIVGFIYANGATFPIREHEVVYIVGSEGQTIERVYGQYNKY